MLRHLLLLIIPLLPLHSPAADYAFRHLTSSQGLPHQQAEAIIQDAKGNIWIGTRNGLTCYDGYETKNYYHDATQPNSLSHNFVHRLFIDSRHRLWVVTDEGVCRYQPATDDFHCYTLQGNISSIVQTSNGRLLCGGDHIYAYNAAHDTFSIYPSVNHGYVVSMTVDRKDNVYIATNSEIYCYDASLTNISHPFGNRFDDFLTGADGIIPMMFDSRGNFWVGRNGQGVMRIGKDGSTTVFGNDRLSNGIVRAITEDKKHNIWLGTEKGLTIISPDDRIEIIRSSFNDPDGLSDNAIYSILCDADENLWIGSYFGGVDMLLHNDDQFSHFKPGLTDENIKGKVARAIIETTPGVYWIASEDGGLNIYDSATHRFRVFTDIPQMGSNVHSLYYDKASKTVWIGTFRNGLFRYNMATRDHKHYLLSNGHNLNSVFSIVRQKNGKLWIGTTLGLFYYDEKNNIFKGCGDEILDNYFVYHLHCDRRDNIWVGTVANGLYRIDAVTGKRTHWSNKSKDAKLLDNYITYIFEDSRGTLWIGTNNNGVQHFDRGRKNISTLNSTTLPQKSCICAINEDSKGDIWISTSQGLYRYSPKKRSMVRYTTENGLPTNHFNFASTLRTADGRMVFGTINGIVSFMPDNLKIKASRLDVRLKALSINNQRQNARTPDSPLKDDIDNTQEIVLSYNQAKSFTIEYGVIEPGASNTIEYQLRLDGIDQNWRSMGQERMFSGFNLAPGTYTLLIRANNNTQDWDNCRVRSLKIIVRPPFYRSAWAYMVYILLLAMMAYLVYRIISYRIRERHAVRMAQMEKEKIEQLDKAKFDFFTSVSHEIKTPLSLVIAPLKLLSRQKLDSESKHNLDIAIKNTRKIESLVNELVTFNKIETDKFPFYVQKGNPLEFIRLNVLAFRELAAEKHLSLTVDCENNGEEVWFSPSYVERILNNLLSNAIKFTPENGSVSIKAAISGSDKDQYTYLQLSVADTGIGIAPEEMDNIWGRYYQTKRGYNVNNSGWGIGLALVKRLVDMHRGHISLTSELGKGSCFTVLLNVSDNAFAPSNYITDDKVIVPISEYKFLNSMTDLNNSTQREDIASGDEEGKTRILIVDDNDDLLEFLRAYFSRDYNVATAHDGKEALEIAESTAIQLVVSDIMMPEMSGIELCKALKGNMATSHIPVILLTAKSEPDDVVEGYQSGAESYVAKPFEPQILELQIKNIIALQKARQSEIVNSPELDVSTSSLTVLDRKFIKDINELVETNIGNSDFSISDITRSLGVSRSLLHTKMRSLMDMSTGDFIRKKRLDLACRLLRETHSVAETAYKAGFSDPNYFSKAFKKYIGISPTEYINSK